ncbi:MAG TPA: transcription termination/antitermination NusG family protein [Methylocystis sp.]|nr:transcription termination/antitermination NusG family protein [Methylocystis sp.]
MAPSLQDPRGRSPAARPDSLAGVERWYVAQTLLRREARAQRELEAQGFRVFMPWALRTVRHARKLRTVRDPAFPGYLFVALDLERDRWRCVNGTIGVARLIMGEETPLPVPLGVVEALRSCVDPTGLCRFDRDLMAGQSIRVTVGPFAQAIGELVHLDAKGRVRVLLEIMGGKITATLDRSALVAA